MKDVALFASIAIVSSLGFAFLLWASTRWVERGGGIAAYLSWAVAVTLLCAQLLWRRTYDAIGVNDVGVPFVATMLWIWLVLGAPVLGTALVALGRRSLRRRDAP